MSWAEISAGEIMVKRGGSVNPAKFPEETFDLYSIPAFDRGERDVLLGKDIGSSKANIAPNDVLISKIIPHIRRCQVVPDIGGNRQVGSGEWIIFRSQEHDPNFLRHFLVSDQFHAQFMNTVAGMGGSLVRARPSAVADIKIPLPSLDEQKRIAAILDKADGLRRKREKAIELTDTLLRAAFLDMFGDPVTNPKGWETVSGKDVFISLRYGTSKKCTQYETNYSLPVLRIPNILDEKISFSNLKYTEVSSTERDKLMLNNGDILFVRSNGNPDYIGRCAVFRDARKSLFASYLIRAQISAEYFVDSEFLKYLISFPSYRTIVVKEAKTTAGNYNISTVGLNNLQFFCPPKAKQHEFLKIATSLNASQASSKENLSKANELISSLTQRAFSGELTG